MGVGLLVVVAIAVTAWLTLSGDEETATSTPTAPALVVLPDVEGLTRAEAAQQLTDAGLEVEIVTRETAEAAPGTVVGQEPAAGSEVEPGSVVQLTVARAPRPVRAPILPPPVATTDSVRLDWSLGEGGSVVDHFDVYRDGERIGTTERSVFLDTDVTSGTKYAYWVVAVGANGTTERSGRHLVLVPVPVTPSNPSTPTNEPPPNEPEPPEEPSWCDWFPSDPDCQ